MAGNSGNLKTVRLTTPVTPEAIAGLEIGTVVYIDGVVYTGREGVYKHIVEDGAPFPEGLAAISNVNFHCSPAAAPKPDGGYAVGAVTATASFRFTKWFDDWFRISGSRVIIGKGGMTGEVYKRQFLPVGAVYLTTVGYGTGALLGRGIRQVREVHWLKELGIAQALWVFDVASFGPFLVESDLAGNSLFERENAKIAGNLAPLYEGTRPAILRRYGETDDRTDELI
jgi:L(+)-tartrate dehydratase beta subunit